MNTPDSTSLLPSSQAASGLGLLVRQDVGRFDRMAWVLALLFLVLLGLAPVAARAQAAGGDALQAQVEGLLKQQSLPQGGTSEGTQRQPWRVEVTLGQLDPRLKLAPCDKVKAYLPENAQLWGKTRVGLRCVVRVLLFRCHGWRPWDRGWRGPKVALPRLLRRIGWRSCMCQTGST